MDFEWDDRKADYNLQKHGVSFIVRLAPDVAAAFPSEEAVNEALRLLLNVAKTTVRQAW